MILMALLFLALSPQGHPSQVRGVVQGSRGGERVGVEVVFVSSGIPGVRVTQVWHPKTGKRRRFYLRLRPRRVHRGRSHLHRTLGFRKVKMVTKLKVVGARNDLKVVPKENHSRILPRKEGG